MTKITKCAHERVLNYITKESLVVDATAGNGHDTLFLANHAAHVTAFDIQKKAILKTKQRIEDAGLTNVTIVHDSHVKMKTYIAHPIDVVMFNLGYLPGSDKHVTTQSNSTLDALKASLSLLRDGGVVMMTVYVGHHQGQKEAKLIEAFVETLAPNDYTVIKHTVINRHLAPFIIEIEKCHS
ncbi:MAG: class I SAM-dependent methyltransferase [Bacillota bacterium]